MKKASTKSRRIKKTKFVPMPKAGLLNWPPSRGPMPTEMAFRESVDVPAYEIELVHVDPKTGVPAKIKRVPPPSPNKATGGKVSMYLNQEVELCATLRPSQWGLIGGAVLQKSRIIPMHMAHTKLKQVKQGKHRIPAYARLETYLPARSLTFDLSYPLSRVARVTIHPYTIIGWRGRKRQWMDVGYVLWQLARAYREVYRKHQKYGVWGHAITDLVFESIEISGNIGRVGIGS